MGFASALHRQRSLVARVALVFALALAPFVVGDAPALGDVSPQDGIVAQTNAFRTANCVPVLAPDAALAAVAQNWAVQLAAAGVLSHNPYAAQQIPSGWTRMGENVAMVGGYADPVSRMIVNWENSSGHRANMLDLRYTSMGAGFATDAGGRSWGVQVFASYPPGPTPWFSDLVGTPFCAEIKWMVDAGITTGYADGTFGPTSPVSRQAMAAFLYRAAGSPAFSPPGVSPFSDVPVDATFYKETAWLADRGIATGYGDGTFRPTDSVSRQAMAAFLYRLDGSPSFSPPGTATFGDVATDATFFSQVEWLSSVGIATGFGDGNFWPAAAVSRQAMAAFLYRNAP